MGANLLNRGESAGALALLGRVHVDVLKAARMIEGSTVHWLSPSRHLEDDISPESYERFRTCTAALAEPDLRAAYVDGWRWARELMDVLAARHGLALPHGLLSQIDQRVSPNHRRVSVSDDACEPQGRATPRDGGPVT